MTIQMMDLRKWQALAEGEVARFHKENARTVRIDVNTTHPVLLYVAQQNEDAEFLCKVDGRDRVEFSVDGPFDLTADGGELRFYTVDGADFTMEKVDHDSFTRIVQRRERNPEIEHMMYLMHQNTEKRIASTIHELEASYERRARREEQKRKREKEAADAIAAAKSIADDAGKAPASSGTPSDSAKTSSGGGASNKDAPKAAGTKEPAKS